MPRTLKRRAEAEASPSPPPQRRRSNSASEESGPENGEEGSYEDDAGGSHDQMVKNLVRLALASEFSRQPLRRADISTKVLHPKSRAFNSVFKGAQDALQNTFGMTLTELPLKERYTVQQKRAAQRSGNNNPASQSQSASSRAYILTSTLPSQYRRLPILAPGKNPSFDAEAGYIGLYTLVVSVIMLSTGQRISENKLNRHLSRVNADEMGIEGEKTDKILKRMEREGYIVKIRERDAVGGEDTIDWVVGPRGKVEIGERGVAGLVRTAYGRDGVEMEELEDRMERSLGHGTFRRKTKRANGEVEVLDEQEQQNGVGNDEQQQQDEPEEPQQNGTARARPAYRGTARPSNGEPVRQQRRGDPRAAPAASRRSTRRGNSFINDEAEGDEEGEDEEREEEEEELEDEEDEEGDQRDEAEDDEDDE